MPARSIPRTKCGDRCIAGVKTDALLRAFGFIVLADLDGRRQFLLFADRRHLVKKSSGRSRQMKPHSV
jgi:hypothetical protein